METEKIVNRLRYELNYTKNELQDVKESNNELRRIVTELCGYVDWITKEKLGVKTSHILIEDAFLYIEDIGYSGRLMRRLLLDYGYFYKCNGKYFPTDRMKALGYYIGEGDHGPIYSPRIIDFIRLLIDDYKKDSDSEL